MSKKGTSLVMKSGKNGKAVWLAVAGLAAALAAGRASAGENLLANPGFEDGTNGWTRVPSSVWKICPGEGYGGTAGLVWENSDPKCYVYPAQPVTLKPGCVYRYTALVKVDRIDHPDKRRMATPVQFGLEWSDDTGKWMGGSYAQPVDDNGILKDGWVRYEGTTQPMPVNVGKAGLLTVVQKGTVGRVRYDDLTLEEGPAKAIAYFVSDAFRDAAHSGKVRFLAPLFLDTATRPLSDYAAEMAYRPVGKKEAVARPASLAADLVTFEMDVADFAMGSQVLSLKVTCVPEKKVLGEKTLRFTRLAHPMRRRVAYDAHRRMLLDGKPFFPLGMYTGNMQKEDFEIYGDGPFNFAIHYGTVKTADLDAYGKMGVLVATDVRSLIYGYNYSARSQLKTLDESKEAFRAKYAEIGDHPALAMWYLNDEAPLSFVENVTDVHDFLHEIDPARATLTCICRPKEASHFLPSYDFVAIDSYPIGYRDLSNALDSVWRRQRETDDFMWRMRPHWYIPQAFSWKWFMNPELVRELGVTDQHFPTRAEMANMTWQGIAAGANGVVMFAFSSMRKHQADGAFTRHWPDVLAVARELKAHEAIVLSDPLATEPAPTKDVVVRAWRQGGRTWHLAVNRARDPASCAVRLAEKASSVRVLVGSGVMLAPGGQALDCAFGPLGYALVETIPENANP